MKRSLLSIFTAVALLGMVGCACFESSESAVKTAEAGCGSCSYQLAGAEGCQVAVKIGDQAYLVDGVEHIEAHEAGLCDGTRSVDVSGEVVDGKFAATYFQFK